MLYKKDPNFLKRDVHIAKCDICIAKRDVHIAKCDICIAKRDVHIAKCDTCIAKRDVYINTQHLHSHAANGGNKVLKGVGLGGAAQVLGYVESI